MAMFDEQELGARVEARLHGWADRLGAKNREAVDRLTSELELARGAPKWSGYFVNDLAQPVLQLPSWLAGVAAAQGVAVDPLTVLDLAECAACGYLAVRLQDDWIDDGRGEPGEVMLLGNTLLTRHAALLGRHVPWGGAFWALFERRWREYAEAMALERSLQQEGGPYDDGLFDQVLGRSRPLELPGAAGLACWRMEQRGPALSELVVLLVRAHQRFHDLVGGEADLVAGHRTPITARYGEDGVGALRRRLFVEGGFDATVALVQADLDGATRAADRLGCAEAVRFVERKKRQVTATQRQVFQRLFAEALSGKI